jgi:glycogen debranching enzyme
MDERLPVEEPFAIVSEAERSSAPVRVLKHGESFAVFDAHGDILPGPASEHGFFHAGTRFLSACELLVGGHRPLLLGSTISDDNAVFTADLTNPDVNGDENGFRLARGLLHVFRSRALWDGVWAERIRVANHALQPIEVPVALRFDADFADVFEVRGTRRRWRGDRVPAPPGRGLLLRYRGRDGVERATRIVADPAPDGAENNRFTFVLRLEPHGVADIEVSIGCELEGEPPIHESFDAIVSRLRAPGRDPARASGVVSANDSFNRWMRRSAADLAMMITETPHGPYPYAGIPWYSTPFGRDGIITALEMLWAAPDVARGVLLFLAATQATSADDEQDAQPGKILHEMRRGEMAALGEIPFARYYGTADATPLFVMLADAYFHRTADRQTIDRVWPNIVAALGWMESYGDLDGDGFIEYARRSHTGLVQQGWKDSFDSVFHADGRLADPPIALCEIQGYAHAAWSGAARLAEARGDGAQAARWQAQADALRERFEAAFWCDDLGTYALALDAAKRPCRVRTSNPGHCLFAGIVSPARARTVANTLMAEGSFAGWGVRTVATGEARYNPMSYHNGSVWPHDTAIVAAGLARYGFTAEATRILEAVFDLSKEVDLHRLPELICGFRRRPGAAPTLYPVACAPQAWAAGAVYLLLQACLGLRIDAAARRISFSHAVLPEAIDWLRLVNLTVADAAVDLLLTRHAYDVGITVLRREGSVEILGLK